MELISRRIRQCLFAIAVVLLPFSGVSAEPAPQISDLRVNLPVAGRAVSAGYLTIRNPSSHEIALVSVASENAGRIEIHSHRHEDGVMRMRREERLSVAPDSQRELKSGGWHLMVFNLSPELKAGDFLPLVLTFEDGTRITVKAPLHDLSSASTN